MPRIQLRSDQTPGYRPLPADLLVGELLVNNEASDPGVYYKTTSNQTLKLGPCYVGATPPNNPQLAASAQTGQLVNLQLSKGELWLDNSGSVNILKLWDGSEWIEAGRSLNQESILTSKTITIKPLEGQQASLLSIFDLNNIESVVVAVDGSTEFSKPVEFSDDVTFTDVATFEYVATFESQINVPDRPSNDSSNLAANTRFVQNRLTAAGVTYTSSNPSLVTVGGIEAGTTFTNAPFSTVIDQLLNPYQNPTIGLTISNIGVSRTIEVGERLLGSTQQILFTTSIQNPQNLLPNSIIYTAAGSTVTNPYTLDYDSIYNVRTSPGSYSWSAAGTNTKNQQVSSNTITITWAHRTFTGYSTSSSVVDTSSLTATGDSLNRPTSATKPAGASSYIYIFLPTSYAAYTSFTSGGFDVPMVSSQVTLSRLGVLVTYNVYRTLNPTAGSLAVNLG